MLSHVHAVCTCLADPRMLNRTTFYTLGQQFGTRWQQEHHDIYLEHLKFVKNPTSGAAEYVEWTERITKTRQGGLYKPGRMVAQKAFAVGGPKCPIALLEKMNTKRPPSLKNYGPLYFQPLCKPKPSVWYSESNQTECKIRWVKAHYKPLCSKNNGQETQESWCQQY